MKCFVYKMACHPLHGGGRLKADFLCATCSFIYTSTFAHNTCMHTEGLGGAHRGIGWGKYSKFVHKLVPDQLYSVLLIFLLGEGFFELQGTWEVRARSSHYHREWRPDHRGARVQGSSRTEDS